MIYLINIILTIVLTFFTFGIYASLDTNATMAFLVYGGWYFILWLISFSYDYNGHFKKLPLIFGLVFFYIKELFKASWRVTYDVLTRHAYMQPGVLAYELRDMSDLEITLLANLITLTPGSLSIDISDDRKILYIHETYMDDFNIEKTKEEIRNGFERRILRITR